MRRALALLALVTLTAATSACGQPDPCAGVGGVCISAHVDSKATPLDQLLLSIDALGERRTPTSPAPLALPVVFAIHLPTGTASPVAITVDGFASGARAATGAKSVALDTHGRGTLDLVLTEASALSDLGDLQSPSDGATSDLATPDLALEDQASSDLTPLVDLTPALDLIGTVELDVIVVGINGGTGTIDVTTGTSCGQGCWRIPGGTSVTLQATAAGDSQLIAMSGDCTFSANPTCTLSMATDKTVLVSFEKVAAPANRVFVTSYQTTLADILSGSTPPTKADKICQSAARDASLPDSGSYVAWLSWSDAKAADRLGSARGWVRPDGLPFADRTVDLTQGHILYPALLDEYGALGVAQTWTGTNPNGSLGTNCTDWSSTSANATIGTPLGGSGDWTFYSPNGDCSTSAGYSLLCLGTGSTNPLVVTTTTRPTRGAFMTSSVFAPGPGTSIQSADNLCTAEATAASLPGTYRAFLTTSLGLAINRFDLSRGPWARRDGVLLSGSPARLDPLSPIVSTARMLAPPDKTSLGDPRPSDSYWIGGGILGNCVDWSINDGGQSGTTEDVGKLHDAPTGTGCNNALPVLCLEQ